MQNVRPLEYRAGADCIFVVAAATVNEPPARVGSFEIPATSGTENISHPSMVFQEPAGSFGAGEQFTVLRLLAS